MTVARNLKQVVSGGLCVSCGACASANEAIRMELDESRGMFVPRSDDSRVLASRGAHFDVCPGVGYPIQAMAEELFGQTAVQTYDLGRVRTLQAAHMADERFLERASSGGVMTGIAAHLLQSGKVDGVASTRFVYGSSGPRTEAYLSRSVDDLLDSQGSKYCPTSTNELVRTCLDQGGRFLFIGLPCQVASLRLAGRQDPRVREAFPLTMANFCGGYRDFREIAWLIESRGLTPSKVTFFRHRGGGQPGSMLIRDVDGREICEPYPDYARGTPVVKHKRCTYCIDATGELADFSCGDAWLDRFRADSAPWSIVMTRSAEAEAVFSDMVSGQVVRTADISPQEVSESQKLNLESKKYRQHKRMRLARSVGMRVPSWDQPLVRGHGTYRQEIRILLSKLLAPVLRRRRG